MQQIVQGATMLATNTDATYPVEGARQEPGAGSIVAAISTCSGVQPEVIGKPNPLLLNLIMEQAGVGPADTLAVGDRYETDLLAGINAGCDTHLVLTGVTRIPPAGQSYSDDVSGLL
jgi:4-nitrophenyl phosphatase